MESSKKAWKDQDKKKMAVKFGGGGIGAVVLLGGALAAAAVASAFVARGKRRSQIPPPPENNKLCGQDEVSIEQDEKERAESNGDVEASDQIHSSTCPKKMGKDDVIDDEESTLMEEKLSLIYKEDVSCDDLKGNRNLEIDCVEREDNDNGVEGVQIARIDVEKEEGVEEFCSEEKSLEVFERIKGHLSEDGSDQERVGNNASLLEIDGEDGEKGLVPVFESLVIEDEKKGGFVVEIVREDEAIEESREDQVEYVEEKCDEGVEVEWIGGVKGSREDHVENVEEKCDEVDDVIEVEEKGEAIEESRETQVNFVEEKCDDEVDEGTEVEQIVEAKQGREDQVEYEEKCDDLDDVIEVEGIGEAIEESREIEVKFVEEQREEIEVEWIVEAKQGREDQVEYLEEKCDEPNKGIEVESIDEAIEESREDQVECVEEKCDESNERIEVESIGEVIEESREDQVEYVEEKRDEVNEGIEVESIGEAIEESREDQVEYVEDKCDEAKDGAKEEVLESLVLNHKSETSVHCPVSQPKDEEASLSTNDGLITETSSDKNDKIQDFNDQVSLSDEAEESSIGTRDSSTESNSESLNDSSINNYRVEEDFPKAHKISTNKLGMIKDLSTNSTRRRMVIATLSLLTSLSCSWFFDLSLVNICLVVFLTMLLSEIPGY